jgi:hypothetical protein
MSRRRLKVAKDPKDASNKDQALVQELKRRLTQRRWIIERNWWGNILFHLGQQWVIYDNNSRRWKQRRLSPSVPTPVTNYFRSTLDTVKSAIAQHEPRYAGIPTRDDARAVAAAASTDAQLSIILKEGRFEKSRARMIDWLLLTGNAFQEVVWDNSDETGLEAVPKEICADCGTIYTADKLDPKKPWCPKCGGMLVESATEYEWVPRGEIRFDTISPFEMYLDPMIEEFEDQPFVIIAQSFTEEQIDQIWNVKVEGGMSTSSTDTSIVHKESIASISPGVAAGSPYAATSGGDMLSKRVVVFRAFIKKHKEYPKGAYIAMTSSGKILDRQTPYPWRTRAGAGKKFYPIIHYKFGTVAGRSWGYSPADDLLPKQYQLNKAESMMTMIMTRMANPVWLIPANTNPSRISGDIGVQIEYTPVGGAAPNRIPGSEAPQSLVKYITDIRQSFDELSGAFAAVRGRSMGSRTPVGTVQSLQERGFGRWATVFDGLEIGYQDMAEKSLEVWRQNAHSPRVMAVKDAIGGFTFAEFTGADWDDGVQVKVEAGSSRPQTQTEKKQTYMEMLQIGVLDPQDEAQKIKLLEDLGMLGMRPGVEEDTKHAYKENAEFMEWARGVGEKLAPLAADPEMQAMAAQQEALAMPVRVVPIVDDHAVHFLTHRRLALTPDFKALPQPLQQAWYFHMMQHQGDMMMSKAIKGMGGPVGPAEGAPPEGGEQPGAKKGGGPPGGGSAHAAPTREMQGGESNPQKNK